MCPIIQYLYRSSLSPYLVVSGHIRDSSVLSCQVVLDLVDGVVLAVDGTDQHVVGNVVQVAAELQPRSSSTDVVCGAFALHLSRQKRGKLKKTFILTPAAVRTFNDKLQQKEETIKDRTLMRTFKSSRSPPLHLSKGSSSCSRLLSGLTFTLRTWPSAGGCW